MFPVLGPNGAVPPRATDSPAEAAPATTAWGFPIGPKKRWVSSPCMGRRLAMRGPLFFFLARFNGDGYGKHASDTYICAENHGTCLSYLECICIG